METKPISEIAKLKIQNANLTLQLIQIQAQQIVSDRAKVIDEEFKRLECKPEEWQLDERGGVLIKKEVPPEKGK